MHERYYRELLRYFTRRAGNGDTAADVVQEAYARVLALQRTGASVFEPRAVLYQAGRNILATLRLRSAVEARVLETLALVSEDSRPSVEREVGARQQLERLLTLLKSMPSRRRDVFILVRIHGMSYAQTAAHMDMTVRTVERQMARALLDCAGYAPGED
ncbi:sigma-70 family RNA polymerase sigma factor [Pigmentiphaga sp. YJ18]|uniref:RNA polymerase sigma factor n=1 Tax=Pigmentiphaga sp. YJ18 TaxID=3134907 RepID=UPI0031165DD0